MKDENVSKIGPWACIPAAILAMSLSSMAWIARAFGAMLTEMGYGGHWPLPLSVRVIVDTPRAVWISFGLLVGGALILTSMLVCAKTAVRIWNIAIIVYGVFMAFIVFSLWRPVVYLSSSGYVGPWWMPF